jgi:Ca-activated chloride channel family protein
VAAAQPYRSAHEAPDRAAARDIVIALDASESMRGLEFARDDRAASRMEVALDLTADFVHRRRGDRIGLVVFGSRAITQCPPTFDTALVRRMLGYIEPEMLGKRTALGEAVALGAARMPDGGALVVLSDGENTSGEVTPGRAARLAAERGVRIYAVAVGTAGPVPVPVRLPSGRTRLVEKDYPLDEATLQMLADQTAGRCFKASDAATLDAVFGEIDRLERHDRPLTRTVPAPGPALAAAAAALACVLAALVLSATWLRTAPQLQ